jgi:hypothetical protein
MRTPEQSPVKAALAVAAVLLIAQAATAQTANDAVADRLRGGTAAERSAALEAVRTAGARNASARVRAALLAALEQEGRLFTDRYHRGRSGEALPDLEDPEFIARASRVVAELDDPAAIPALTAALGTGFTVIHALTAFGDQAVPSVVSAVVSPDSMPDALNHGLITLRFMVENLDTRPLSASSAALIRRAAQQRLRMADNTFVTTVWRAIDLAVTLDDPEFRQTVELLASDYGTAISSGIDPEYVDQTARRASERLAGTPALPRP